MILGVSSSAVLICDVVVIIWVNFLFTFKALAFKVFHCFCFQGSIVVFSNYSSWSYTDHESEYYCHKTPMLFAFILLLIKWLLIPVILIIGCVSALCCPQSRESLTEVEE